MSTKPRIILVALLCFTLNGNLKGGVGPSVSDNLSCKRLRHWFTKVSISSCEYFAFLEAKAQCSYMNHPNEDLQLWASLTLESKQLPAGLVLNFGSLRAEVAYGLR